jgi:Putative adhesin
MQVLRSSAVACGLWLVASLIAVSPIGGQGTAANQDFRWSGAVASGRWVYARNLNGSVRVERGTGTQLEVTAVKRYRRGNPENVTVEVKRVGSGEGDVLVCAIWRDITEVCNERDYRTYNNNRRRDRYRDDDDDMVSLEITVRVPEGVKVDVSSINGGLDITGATSEVEAHTVNGGIDARSTGGPVNASTVNGDVDVRMGAVGSGNLDFSTTNGSVTVTVPDGLNADITMRTVNGSVGSDFPMTVNGRISPRRIAATIGRGGMKIDLSTVNGSIDLRRG